MAGFIIRDGVETIANGLVTLRNELFRRKVRKLQLKREIFGSTCLDATFDLFLVETRRRRNEETVLRQEEFFGRDEHRFMVGEETFDGETMSGEEVDNVLEHELEVWEFFVALEFDATKPSKDTDPMKAL